MISFLKTHWRFWITPIFLGAGVIAVAVVLLTSSLAPAQEKAEQGRMPVQREYQQDEKIVSKVIVTTNQHEYERNAKIRAMVTNELETSITTFDQQYNCTIIRIEERTGTGWEEVRKCISGTPSVNVTLLPHTETVVNLRPTFGPLPHGVYRASVIFSLGETFTFRQAFISSSAPFEVR